MYYVPNMLIRRSRAPSDVFTVTLQTDSEYTYDCRPYLSAGATLNVDWGDGSPPETWGSDKNGVAQTHTYGSGTYVVSFWGQATRLIVAAGATTRDPLKQCNFNWGALPELNSCVGMFGNCPYLVSPLTSLPEVSNFTSMFRACTRLPIAPGVVLPTTATGCNDMFYACGAADYDINDLGSSFPLLTSITGMFQGSYFYGDATAFKNKCAANVTYTNAFLNSRCTNIPA